MSAEKDALIHDLTLKLTTDLDQAMARTILLADDPNDHIKIVANLNEFVFRTLSEMVYAYSMDKVAYPPPLHMKEQHVVQTVDLMAYKLKQRFIDLERRIHEDPKEQAFYTQMTNAMRSRMRNRR